MTKNNTISNFFNDFPTNILLSQSLAQDIIPFSLLIIGVFAVSSTAIFFKLALQELTVEAILFDSLLMTTVIFTSWNWISSFWQSETNENNQDLLLKEEINHSVEKEQPTASIIIGLMLLLVIANLSGGFLYIWSLKETTAVNATILSNLTPIFTFLGAWLFIGKQFDRRFLIGLIAAIIGSVFLTLEDWLNLEQQLLGTMVILGDGAALLCAVFHALSILLKEKLLKHLSNITLLTWSCAIGLAFIAPVVWIEGNPILPATSTGWFAVLGFGLIGGIIGNSLIVYSFKHFSAAFLSIVLLLEPFPVAFFAWFFLGEFLLIFNIIGFILISTGIYLARIGKGSEAVNNSLTS